MDADSTRIARARTALGLDDPRLMGLLLLLWVSTGGFVAMHLSHFFLGMPESPLSDLSLERGYGDVFFQMLTGWTILLLVIVAVRRRAGILLIWAAAATYLLIDDYFVIHERFGGWFALNVRTSAHLGELLFLGFIGTILLVAIAVAYRFARPDLRRITMILAVLFAAMAFFGVGVDALNALVRANPTADPLFTAVEDGGEIAALSVLVVYLVSLAFPPAVVTTAARAGAAPPHPR